MTQEEYVIPASTLSKILEEVKKLNYGLGNISDAVSQLPQDNKCCDEEPEGIKERKVEEYDIRFTVSIETDNPLKVVGEIIDHLTETYGEDTKVRDLSIYST